MSTLSRQRGFGALEAIAAVVIVLAVGFAAWFVVNRMQDDEPANTTTTAPEVNETSDLDDATKALDDTNLDASSQDSSELDAELHYF